MVRFRPQSQKDGVRRTTLNCRNMATAGFAESAEEAAYLRMRNERRREFFTPIGRVEEACRSR